MSTSFKDLRGRFNVVADEMSALVQQETRTDDEEAKLDQLLAEFNDLSPKVERAAVAEDAAKRAGDMQRSRGATGSMVAADGAEERAETHHQSIGARFAHSDQMEEYRQMGGGPKSKPMEVGSYFHGSKIGATYTDESGPVDRRALIAAGSMPASYIQPTYVPGFFRGDEPQATIRSVLFNGQTSSDAITFYRELVATNNAAPVLEATASSGESGLKPESGITFEEVTAPVKTIATHIPVTRQLLWDAPAMQSYIEGRLIDFLRAEESDQLLNGNGTGANFTGILETTGVQALDDTGATGSYFFDNPVADAGTSNENFNRILRAKTLVRTVGKAQANFVVLNPADLEEFLSSTDAQRQYFGAGPFSGNGIPNLWGMRVVEDENMTAGSSLVGDGRMAGVWDRMQAQILIDTINDQFVRNMLTILAEERLALTVFRPVAFAEVALA